MYTSAYTNKHTHYPTSIEYLRASLSMRLCSKREHRRTFLSFGEDIFVFHIYTHGCVRTHKQAQECKNHNNTEQYTDRYRHRSMHKGMIYYGCLWSLDWLTFILFDVFHFAPILTFFFYFSRTFDLYLFLWQKVHRSECHFVIYSRLQPSATKTYRKFQ